MYLELVRQADVLTMRVYLINRAGPLDRRHRIVFGLQTTPTQPMPEGWRRWTGLKPIEGARPVRWVGATFYWGGVSFDLYPYKGRFNFLDKLAAARRTGEADRQFIDQWMQMVDGELAAKGTDR